MVIPWGLGDKTTIASLHFRFGSIKTVGDSRIALCLIRRKDQDKNGFVNDCLYTYNTSLPLEASGGMTQGKGQADWIQLNEI